MEVGLVFYMGLGLWSLPSALGLGRSLGLGIGFGLGLRSGLN